MNDMKFKTGDRAVVSRAYLASLPERTARAGAALTGGLVYEASEVVLPLAVRRSRLYQTIVGRLLRITIELVGGVEGVYPAQEMSVRELLARKTAGNAVELSSFLAVGWSPLWLLAGASDLVGGTKVYLRALVTELRDAGVLAAGAEVTSFEELLTVLEGTSGMLADTVDVPPLNVPSVRTSWQELQAQAASLPDAAGMESIFAELQLAARQEDRSILEISSMVALGASGREAGKRSHLRLLPPRATNDSGSGPALVSAANQHPLPDAGGFTLRSPVEHLLRTPATALGGSALACGAPDDAADRSIGRGKCRRSWLRPGAPPLT